MVGAIIALVVVGVVVLIVIGAASTSDAIGVVNSDNLPLTSAATMAQPF